MCATYCFSQTLNEWHSSWLPCGPQGGTLPKKREDTGGKFECQSWQTHSTSSLMDSTYSTSSVSGLVSSKRRLHSPPYLGERDLAGTERRAVVGKAEASRNLPGKNASKSRVRWWQRRGDKPKWSKNHGDHFQLLGCGSNPRKPRGEHQKIGGKWM